jgi:hypothetical protein
MKRFETTPGRMLIGECLPQEPQGAFDVVNRLLTKKEVGDVIDIVYRHAARKRRCCSPTRSWVSASACVQGGHFLRQG